jgi:hypothetical protein
MLHETLYARPTTKILDAYDHQHGSQRAPAALFGVRRAFLE